MSQVLPWMREDESRRKRLRQLFFVLIFQIRNCHMFSTLLLLAIFVNVTSINYILCYKSFSLFKAFHIFFCVLFAVLLFDFIISDLNILTVLHEVWDEYFYLKGIWDISHMRSILTIFDPNNGSWSFSIKVNGNIMIYASCEDLFGYICYRKYICLVERQGSFFWIIWKYLLDWLLILNM